MSDAKHTPGPWKLEEWGDEYHDLSVIARGEIVSGCVANINTQWAHENQRLEQRANAELIASAPLLLAQCDRLKMGLKRFIEWYDAKREGRDHILVGVVAEMGKEALAEVEKSHE